MDDFFEHARVLAVALGEAAGMAVLAGTMTAEEAGDKWLTLADREHSLGDAFLIAFDRTGAQR